ncbi:hypothetical protein ACQQCD_12570 [Pseudarthrobacter sp. J1763]|jgi:hypothetical protein
MAENKSNNPGSSGSGRTTKLSEGQKPASISVQPQTMKPGSAPAAPKK